MNSSRFEALQRLGFSSFFQHQLPGFQHQLPSSRGQNEAFGEALVARVLAEMRGQYLVSAGSGALRAVLAGRLSHEGVSVCVGDFVLLEAERTVGALASVVQVFERSSLFRRKASGGTSSAQLIAANVDLAIVVCALASDDADAQVRSHGLNPRRVERYLRAIRDAPARALVVLNKADLSASAHAQAARLERELRGVPVILVSAEHGHGLRALETELCAGSTAVLVGSSGVGKSSLANRLLGTPAQTVSAIRENDARGRHTTTSRELFALPGGGLLIDTPGMREFSLFADAETELGGSGFAEIDELSASCRFRDCSHHSEPGCAVLAAVQAGVVLGERPEQAHKLERELAWQRDRHDPVKLSEQRSARRARTRSVRAELKQRKGG